MAFEQAQIPVQKAEEFEQLRSAIERIFSSPALEAIPPIRSNADSNPIIRRIPFHASASSGPIFARNAIHSSSVNRP